VIASKTVHSTTFTSGIGWWKSTDDSEENITAIFMVEGQAEQEARINQ
jgi:hypothetical protein